jgi:pyruvate,water dikinase
MITTEGPRDVDPAQQSMPCLTKDRLTELAALGRRIEAVFGEARDVEWAWAEGQFWLLQARPITAQGAAEIAEVRREELERLRRLAEPTGTIWSRINLA